VLVAEGVDIVSGLASELPDEYSALVLDSGAGV